MGTGTYMNISGDHKTTPEMTGPVETCEESGSDDFLNDDAP